jgi:hypothetical protein
MSVPNKETDENSLCTGETSSYFSASLERDETVFSHLLNLVGCSSHSLLESLDCIHSKELGETAHESSSRA